MQPFQVRFSAPKVGYRGWHEAALEAISVDNPGCPNTRNYMCVYSILEHIPVQL